jgi:hypothetical protein
LVELLDGLLDDVGPKVTLKVRDVRHTVARVRRVFEQVLQIYTNIIKFSQAIGRFVCSTLCLYDMYKLCRI